MSALPRHPREGLARESDGWRIVPPPGQVIAHTNLCWRYQSAPGRTAGTVETKAVRFA